MKLTEILLVNSIVLIMCIAGLDALDRSIYPGCKVVDQIGETLHIRLDEELMSATDMACHGVEKIVKAIQRDGYDVRILMQPEEWAAFPALHLRPEH